jgi:lipoyl(octanoyl) transferase
MDGMVSAPILPRAIDMGEPLAGAGPAAGPDWFRSRHPVPYDQAMLAMEARVAAVVAGSAREAVWLLEHPPVITAGTAAQCRDLLDPGRFPVVATGRGGRFTYHGPGQRIAYVMLDLGRRGRDVRRYVDALEGWAIAALADCGVAGFRSPIGTGIWVEENGRPAKIGAIGVRIRRWVAFHGIAINASTDLDHYRAILPCGIAGHPVTSLERLGRSTSLAALDAALARHFPALLGALGPTPLPAPTNALEAAAECR